MSSQFENLGERIRDFVLPYLEGVQSELNERSRELRLAQPLGFLLIDAIVVRETELDNQECAN